MHPHVLYIDCTSIVLMGCSYKWAVRKCSSVSSARSSTETSIVLMVGGPDKWVGGKHLLLARCMSCICTFVKFFKRKKLLAEPNVGSLK